MSHSPRTPPAAADAVAAAGGEKPYTAPAKQIWGWGAGRVAEFGLVAMFGQAMNIFTVGFGLSPVVVSWCMMLPRLVDGIVDPIIGHWSDQTHTRWGRRKPFLIVGAFAGAFFLSILWWASPSWNQTAQFLFLGIVGMFLYLCYGTYTMAWNAIGYELSDEYHERARIQAIGGFFTAAMALLNSWIYWLALRPSFGGVVWGMRWIGAAVAILIIGSALITAFSTKERFAHANRQHVPILPAIKTALGNRPFVILLLMKLFEVFGGRLTGGIMFFLSIYYVCRGDQDLGTKITGIGATLGTVWSFAVLPLVKPASQWIGKRGALIAGAGLSFVSALFLPFFTTPDHPYWSLIPNLVLLPVVALSTIIANAILPDICDVDELKTGQRREGLFTSVMAFVAKIEISLAVVLVGYIVSWSGVDTKISLRWQETADGKPQAAAAFAPGERAVFNFKEKQPATFDTFVLNGSVLEVELFASSESPTTGFSSIGRFTAADNDPLTAEKWTFPPVTAKYFKIELAPGSDRREKAGISELRLTHAAAEPNLLATDHGGAIAAAEPPNRIGRALYWLVMVPGIIFTGLTFVMTILFPLTEAKMREVRRKLDEIRLAKAAVGEPTDAVAEEFVHDHPRKTAEFVRQHPDLIEKVEHDEIPPEGK